MMTMSTTTTTTAKTTMTINKLDWDAATALVQDAKTILIVTHVKPDGDAIGSMLGLANALRAAGKQVDAAVDDGTPKYLSFMPGADKVYAKITVGKWDVMISVDASDEARTGMVGAYGRNNSKAIVNLDHHATNTMFGDAHLISETAVSATEVIYHWLQHMGTPPTTPDVAMPLLTGLVTDTMGFRISSVRAETLGVAQALMSTGVSLHDIITRTLESKPFHVLKLWGLALGSIQLDGQVVSVNITAADLKTANMDEASDSGLVSLLNQIDEARVAVIFFELPDEKVKLSMRSKQGYDVGAVALALGGGGHKQASGATISGTLEAARERVLPMLQAAVAQGASPLA